ncbi:hypothetical protein B0A54_08877 [Friedmanniomyces endolithicus]|uniref:Cyanovirin-N domain-containing protein n=1 Tax=Friedmanniomyces endolithicus TaxID=329885 RepID=A0A4V5N7L6_9PEZI|nr:hypothetical protein B0A54_08877 [Friedmanniomyces endolithicus]
MQFTTSTLLLALAATLSASAIPGFTTILPPSALLAADYPNAVHCGQKNPAVNMAIDNFCNRVNSHGQVANNLTIGTPWARNGVTHDGFRVSITGPTCPGNSRWVPAEYCNAQFHYLCAVRGGPMGAGEMEFGASGCQEWKIERL